jgi:hypothetical protein
LKEFYGHAIKYPILNQWTSPHPLHPLPLPLPTGFQAGAGERGRVRGILNIFAGISPEILVYLERHE